MVQGLLQPITITHRFFTMSLTQSASWKALEAHKQDLQNFSIEQALIEDSTRSETFSAEAAGVFLDYSKHLITDETLKLFKQLAEQQGLRDAITRLKNGAHVNFTEDRPALHSLLRSNDKADIHQHLHSTFDEIAEVKAAMKKLSHDIYNGTLRGYTGKPFTDIVHIGIGGSDLGPAMIYQALSPYHQANINCHFVANICANDITETVYKLNPHTTLFIIASKSFTTLETLENAKTARAWLLESLIDEEAIANHFFAVSAKPEKAQAWGIKAEHVLPFWDFVGGRYSSWSAIGLSLCIGLGYDNFSDLLAGAENLDQHFFTAELDQNLPFIMAMLGIWYGNFHHRQSHAVIPYDSRLQRFAQFLQQLEMESNGKSTNRDNQPIDYSTCPEIWGEAGANSQHSFFQKFHQGTAFTPIDFIAVINSPHQLQHHQDWLVANCFAQSRALMLGQTDSTPELGEHKFMPGNKPSSTLVVNELTPQTLGALMALYEHKVYVQSIIWEINAFDQWGVELGKTVSKTIKAAMDDKHSKADFIDAGLDASTAALLARYKKASTS